VGVEFVAYAGELVGMSRTDSLQRAHEVLDYVGLGEARYRMVESYSTGMKQRLKLASAIVHDPQLLILDEPTNGMDPSGRQEVLELAHDLAHNKGMNVLFSSHLLPDVEAVCGKVGGIAEYSKFFGPLSGRLHAILEEGRAIIDVFEPLNKSRRDPPGQSGERVGESVRARPANALE